MPATPEPKSTKSTMPKPKPKPKSVKKDTPVKPVKKDKEVTTEKGSGMGSKAGKGLKRSGSGKSPLPEPLPVPSGPSSEKKPKLNENIAQFLVPRSNSSQPSSTSTSIGAVSVSDVTDVSQTQIKMEVDAPPTTAENLGTTTAAAVTATKNSHSNSIDPIAAPVAAVAAQTPDIPEVEVESESGVTVKVQVEVKVPNVPVPAVEIGEGVAPPVNNPDTNTDASPSDCPEPPSEIAIDPLPLSKVVPLNPTGKLDWKISKTGAVDLRVDDDRLYFAPPGGPGKLYKHPENKVSFIRAEAQPNVYAGAHEAKAWQLPDGWVCPPQVERPVVWSLDSMMQWPDHNIGVAQRVMPAGAINYLRHTLAAREYRTMFSGVDAPGGIRDESREGCRGGEFEASAAVIVIVSLDRLESA